MERHIDEFEIEKGFTINTDLRVEFEYNGEPDDGLDFGEIWTLVFQAKDGKAHYSDGIRIDERADFERIVSAAMHHVLTNHMDDIHDEWVESAREDYDERGDHYYQLRKDDQLEPS